MKVILLQELKGRGGEGDVIEVARGFAVNYLLPRKIAIQATSGNLKQLEQRRHNIQKREDSRLESSNALAAALEGKSVTIAAKVGEEGKLFGSVTSHMIEAAIVEQLGVEVDRRKIDTHGHIKEAGEHTVEVTVYRDIKAHLTVKVVAEGAPVVAQAPLATEEPVAEPVEALEDVAAEAEVSDEVASDDTDVEVASESEEAAE